MSPQVAEELNALPELFDAADVLRAISAGTRRAGARAVSVGELDEIAAEMSGPPWP